LSSTIVTTLHAVASAIGCTVHIEKIRRCSNAQAAAADALSKGQFAVARQLAQLDTEPARIPPTLVRWIDQPQPSDDLAHAILTELAASSPILNYSV
jgi:hypothetical protein